jgi:hypothetical protein
MPRPVFGTTLGGLAPGASFTQNFSHSGGRICVWTICLLGGTAVPTITFNGTVGSSVIYTYPSPIWRVHASATEIAAGTVSVTISGLTSAYLTFFVFGSVSNWLGTVRASYSAPATIYQHVGTAVAANETFVANWLESSADYPTDQVEPSLVSNNAETFYVGATSGVVNDIARQFIVFRSSATGTATAKVLETVSAPSGWGNSSISMIFIGTTTQTFTQAVGGNLNFSGALTKSSLRLKSQTGNLNFSGALTRKLSLSKALTGSLSFNGTLTGAAKKLRVLAGNLTFSGALAVRQTRFTRLLAGVLSFSGGFRKKMKIAFIGRLRWVGDLLTSPSASYQSVDGSLDFQGNLTRTRTFERILDGTLRFLGDLGTFFIKAPRRFTVALFAQLTVVHNRLRR